MSGEAADLDRLWEDAAVMVALAAVDPVGCGGLRLRGGPGPVRDTILRWLRDLADGPFRVLPSHVTEDRLLGGIALAKTLERGRIVVEEGLLAGADGGWVIVPMAERLRSSITPHLASALDRGEVAVERDGVSASLECRVGCVLLDEGLEGEASPAPLLDRVAFTVDLGALARAPAAGSLRTLDSAALRPPISPGEVQEARARMTAIAIGEREIEALCAAAVVLGVSSLRAPLLAAHVARGHAALAGRVEVSSEDVEVAARLTLGPRATRLPSEETPEEDAPPPPPPPDTPEDREPPDQEEEAPPPLSPRELEDLVLEAAASGIPEGLLDELKTGSARGSAPGAGQAGDLRVSMTGGRPAGTISGAPRDGERLNVVETLRAAAPWQRLRGAGDGRVRVRREDFRTRRFRQPNETSVIFVVDASGSAALQRLAEAKGAVEQVLRDCYVRRDQVALVAFRKQAAELLLPPTRSLARARRCLAALAGGGATPLASGIEAARALAVDARRRGRTPLIVLMTDGRANVTLSGEAEPQTATEEALASAREVARLAIPCLFLDTASRPRPRGKALAEAMGARYLPLPYLDAEGISREVQRLQPA